MPHPRIDIFLGYGIKGTFDVRTIKSIPKAAPPAGRALPGVIAMKKKIRNSKTKRSKKTGFRYRNTTRAGKKIIARRRRKGSTI